MKKTVVYCLILTIVIASAGCTTILEGDTLSISDRPRVATSNERPEEEQIEVSSYVELVGVMRGLITEHEEHGLLVVYSYDGDVQTDVNRAIYVIMNDDPMAVYAVSDIEGTVTRIVSYFEVNIRIEYKRTREQVSSIVTVPTTRALRTELLSIMSEYREEAVFRMSLQITEDDMLEFVKETYYQNPRSIVMLPVTIVETLTAGGDERFTELRFAYIDRESSALREISTSLAGSVRMNALRAEGENDAEILLSLVENLIGACNYDEATARTFSEHGVQNIAATAYGAMVIGNAAGEGFAMAFKALCDELDLDCRVELGYLNGMVHAWNIVSLNGENYHIDAAMCAKNGIETAFFKTDADFISTYIWDMENSLECNGSLTYLDIVGVDSDDEDNDENGDETDGETDDEVVDEGVDATDSEAEDL